MNARTVSKRKQTFAITAPKATSVLLAGDFTHWQESAIPLKQKANGHWQTSVPLEPGTYRYRFIIDGKWEDDPDCTLRLPNPYGTLDDVRQVA